MGNMYRSRLGASGGVQPTGNAQPADVLSGKTFSNADGVGKTGTMVNNGAVSETLDAGESYTIPAGYHNGNGVVECIASKWIDSGYGIKFGASVNCEIIALSTSPISSTARMVHIFNTDGFSTITINESAFTGQKLACISNGAASTVTITNNVPIDITNYDYVMFEGQGTGTITLGT